VESVESISYDDSSVTMAHPKNHQSIRITSFDRSVQQQQQQLLRLSGFNLARPSQLKTTDSGGMPTVSGSRRKGVHAHGGQVRPALLLTQLNVKVSYRIFSVSLYDPG